MTDFRALCAELVDVATAHCHPDDDAVDYCAAVLARARAALAQPEPQGPGDKELLELFNQFDIHGTADETKGMPLDTFWDAYQPQEALKFARAVLDRWGGFQSNAQNPGVSQ